MSEQALSELTACQASLPRVGSAGLIRGTLRERPEDFLVEELPAYAPSGHGEHLYLFVEKRERNTQDVARELERALGAPEGGSGWAGLKDRFAITRQWLSFHCPDTPPAETLGGEGVRVLAVSRHENKLRTGHLEGNRFTLRLRGVPSEHDERMQGTLSQLADLGIPNYFGAQRFGHEAQNLARAYAWIVQGGRAPKSPFLRKLGVSVLQAALFNAWLGARIERHGLAAALSGDVMRKEDTGGLFVSDAADVEAERVRRWEVSATGPMFGAKMRDPKGEALLEEERILARFAVPRAQLAAVKKHGEGTRRPSRVRAHDLSWEREGSDIVLRFRLPKGAYATVLMRELLEHGDELDGE